MAKILIVDDAEAIRVELKDALEENGHTVVVAVDGNDGLHKAEADTHFDLVISDFNMPGMDGLSMLRKIKALPQYSNTPLAMLTTETSQELRDAGKALGVLVWFVKPFDKTRVLNTLVKVFEKYPPAA